MTKKDIQNIRLLVEQHNYDDVIPHPAVIYGSPEKLEAYRQQLNKMLIDVILKGREVSPNVRKLHNLSDDYRMYDYNPDVVSLVLKNQNGLIKLTGEGEILSKLQPLLSQEELKKLQDLYFKDFRELIPDPSQTRESENYPLFVSLYLRNKLTNRWKVLKSGIVHNPNQLENAYKALLNFVNSGQLSQNDIPAIVAEYDKGSQIV